MLNRTKVLLLPGLAHVWMHISLAKGNMRATSWCFSTLFLFEQQPRGSLNAHDYIYIPDYGALNQDQVGALNPRSRHKWLFTYITRTLALI